MIKTTKGSTWESTVTELFREAMPGLDTHKAIQYKMSSTEKAPDVNLGNLLWAECKHQKQPNIKRALEQVERYITETNTANIMGISICKWHNTNDKKAIVGIRLDDFLELMHDWWKAYAR